MDAKRVESTARNIGGKAEEAFGSAVGDAKTQAQGVADQIKGTAQDLYGQARDSASRFADDATVAGRGAAVASRQAAVSFEGTLRDTIVDHPYAVVLVAAGIGWLLGRARQPM